MTSRFLLLALALVAVTPRGAWAQIVTTPGELNAALNASQPGDVITMANGTWSNTSIIFDRDGLPGDSITLRAQTPGEVILTGISTLSIGGDYLKVDGLRFEGGALGNGAGSVIQFRRSSSDLASHSRLTNTTVIDFNAPGIETDYKWVSLYGMENRVDHCYFAGKTHRGATLVVWLIESPTATPPAHRIDHNHFGPRPRFYDNGAETIRIGTSDVSMQDANTVVEQNLFTETDGETEAISNKSGGNVFRGNTFRRVKATLTLRHGNRALVEGNFFFGEGLSSTGGVRIIGEDHRVVNNYFQDVTGNGYSAAISIVQGVVDSPLNRYFQVKRPLVANNTFVNVTRPFEIGVATSSDQSLPAQDITVVNNVVQVPLNVRIITETLPSTGTSTWTGNIFFGQPSNSFPPGITFLPPELALGADGLYRPSATSPVIGAAVPGFAPMRDMDGQARTDGAPDSGADEVSSASVIFRPLNPDDVGPMWRMNTAGEAPAAPRGARLGAPMPNPASHAASLGFELDRPSQVRLRLVDVTGRAVLTVLDQRLGAGAHTARLDTSALATGTYIVLLDADGQTDRRLITVAR